MRAFVMAGVALAAGCQEQRTVVLEQSSAASLAATGAPPRIVHSSPCASPRGSGPFERLQQPIGGESVSAPPRAQAAHVAGCAGMRFRIGPDGVPTDVTLVAEYPIGYGFGEAGLYKLKTLRWPPRDDLAWHYLIVNLLPKPSA